MSSPTEGLAREFAERHRPGRPLFLPNAWDVGSALALVRAGFVAVGTTSLGVAVAAGQPDGQAATRAETLDLVRRLRGRVRLLSVDIEGGFSEDPDEVADFVAELAALGAVGVNLEDGRGDTLADPTRLAVVIAAVKARTPEVFVNARTDTYWLARQETPSWTDTVDRLDTYRRAGADGVFVPGLADPDRIRDLVGQIGCPVNILYSGVSTIEELAALGVARISCGSLLFRASLHAAVQTALALDRGEPAPEGLPGYAEVARLTRR